MMWHLGMLRPRDLRSTSKFGETQSVLLSGWLPINLVLLWEIEKGVHSPLGGGISALEYTDDGSKHRLDFSPHWLQWPESFYRQLSAQLHIEGLGGLRVFFWPKANWCPHTKNYLKRARYYRRKTIRILFIDKSSSRGCKIIRHI